MIRTIVKACLVGAIWGNDCLNSALADPPEKQAESSNLEKTVDPSGLITPWFLPNNEARQQGMQNYLQTHFGEHPPIQLQPKVVVVHWTGSTTAKSAWNTFASATLGSRKDIRRGGDVNVAAHFLVDRDGTIYQLLPETDFARHCIGFNHISIAIENVGGTATTPMTPAQLGANIALILDLKSRHDIQWVLGHSEMKGMETHPLYQEQIANYRSVKIDPDIQFMTAIRNGLPFLADAQSTGEVSQ